LKEAHVKATNCAFWLVAGAFLLAPQSAALANVVFPLFSAPIEGVVVVPGTNDNWRWDLHAFSVTNVQIITLNGVDIFGTMSVQLYGSSSSTSILPLSFPSYTQGIFQMQAANLDQSTGANYYGPLDSLIQVDSAAHFALTGAISKSNLWSNSSPVPGPSPVPEPSVMILIVSCIAIAGLTFRSGR
jgi:hypothetical protein